MTRSPWSWTQDWNISVQFRVIASCMLKGTKFWPPPNWNWAKVVLYSHRSRQPPETKTSLQDLDVSHKQGWIVAVRPRWSPSTTMNAHNQEHQQCNSFRMDKVHLLLPWKPPAYKSSVSTWLRAKWQSMPCFRRQQLSMYSRLPDTVKTEMRHENYIQNRCNLYG